MPTENMRKQNSNFLKNIVTNQYGVVKPWDFQEKTRSNRSFIQRLRRWTVLEGHEGCVNTVAWNTSGYLLLTGSDDYRLNIYDVYAEKMLQSIESGHRANIFSAKFLPCTSDMKIVSCSGDGVLHYNELGTLYGQNNFNCHSGTTYEVVVTPGDPNTFLSCGEDGTVRIFDLRTKTKCHCQECSEDILLDIRHAVTSICVNPLLPYHLAVGCKDSFVRVFDRRTLGSSSATRSVNRNRHWMPGLFSKFKPEELKKNMPCRVTSLQYSNDGEDLLVSYCTDYVYAFTVKESTSKRMNTNINGKQQLDYAEDLPPLKRFRLRGDWSDTGPQARPEMDEENSPEDNLMQRMSELFSRYVDDIIVASLRSASTSSESSHSVDNATPEALNVPERDLEVSLDSVDENWMRSEVTNDNNDVENNIASTAILNVANDNNDVENNMTVATISNVANDNNDVFVDNNIVGAAMSNLNNDIPSLQFENNINVFEDNKSNELNTSEVTNRGTPVTRSNVLKRTYPNNQNKTTNNFLPSEVNRSVEYNGVSSHASNTLVSSDILVDSNENSTHPTDVPQIQGHVDESTPLLFPALPSNSLTIHTVANSEVAVHTCGEGNNNSLSSVVTEACQSEQQNSIQTSVRMLNVQEHTVDLTSFERHRLMEQVFRERQESESNHEIAATHESENSYMESDIGQTHKPESSVLCSTHESENSIMESDIGATHEPENNFMESNIDATHEPENNFMESDVATTHSRSVNHYFTSSNASNRDVAATRIQRFLREHKARFSRDSHSDDEKVREVFNPKSSMIYKGHRNSRTMIKEANFWGDNFILSGSDCGRIFIWDRHTGELVMLLQGDRHVVNCVQPNPYDPILATSGIDHDIKIWAPLEGQPSTVIDMDEIVRRNEQMLEESRDTITVPASFVFRMLASLGNIRSRRNRIQVTDEAEDE